MKTLLRVQADGSLALPREWQQRGFGPGVLLEVEPGNCELTLRLVDDDSKREVQPFAWRECMGTLSREDAAEINTIVEKEFERVDPADWQ